MQLLLPLRNRLRDLAWPVFDCEDCIGMREHGCYCSATGAAAPGVGPNPREVWLRRLVERLDALIWPLPRRPGPLVLHYT